MYKRILCILSVLFLCLCFTAQAQDTLRISQSVERGVVTKAEHLRKDRNGKVCAVLQVQGPHIKEYTFECSSMVGDILYDDLHNVATLFLVAGAKRTRLAVFHPECPKKNVNLPSLEGHKYYDMQVNVVHDLLRTEPKKLEREIRFEREYRVPAQTSAVAARGLVIERAQIDAMAFEFGSERSIPEDPSGSATPSAIHPQALLSTEVNGYWLADLNAPKVKKQGNDKKTGDAVYRVQLHFRAKERTHIPVDCRVNLLRNGENDENISTEFAHGDKMYIKYNSQADGYLLIYLMDNDGNLFNIVPHWNSHDRAKRIHGHVNYILLSDRDRHAKDDDAVPRGLELTCTPGLAVEYNCLYFIYSPNKISKQMTKASEGKAESAMSDITFPTFQEWLNELRNLDEELQVTQYMFSIKQK